MSPFSKRPSGAILKPSGVKSMSWEVLSARASTASQNSGIRSVFVVCRPALSAVPRSVADVNATRRQAQQPDWATGDTAGCPGHVIDLLVWHASHLTSYHVVCSAAIFGCWTTPFHQPRYEVISVAILTDWSTPREFNWDDQLRL
jgi:hypothetical protein